MASPEAVVTDTHPLLFHAAGGSRLGRAAARVFAAAERREALVYVPVVVIWECSLLARLGRVHLGRSAEHFFGELFSNPAYQVLDLNAAQVYLADGRRPNEDPFDALICAAAMTVGLPLVTRDTAIQESGLVKTVW